MIANPDPCPKWACLKACAPTSKIIILVYEQHVHLHLPSPWYPSCVHTTLAPWLSQKLPHTVFQIPHRQTSTLPSYLLVPFTSLTMPWEQLAAFALWINFLWYMTICGKSIIQLLILTALTSMSQAPIAQAKDPLWKLLQVATMLWKSYSIPKE